MKNWYRYVMFYHYPGEQIARAFAFNEQAMYKNCMDLGAIILDVFYANGAARDLCSKVNQYPEHMPITRYRDYINERGPSNFRSAETELQSIFFA